MYVYDLPNMITLFTKINTQFLSETRKPKPKISLVSIILCEFFDPKYNIKCVKIKIHLLL